MAILPITTLLIDDSEIDLFIQKRFLEVFQFSESLITFSSARDALKSLQKDGQIFSPTLILLDLNMPDMDGFGFLDGLNTLSAEKLANIQIVILTSSNSQTDFEKAFSYGRVIHFITKPLKQNDLQVIQEKIKTWR